MVYFVDDDAGFRDSLEWTFESKRIEFRGFATASAFLENYSSDRPNCLILDLQLEEIHGIDLLKRLREERKYISPVIVVTGTAKINHVVQAMKLGAVDFFEKPVNPNTLMASVQDALLADSTRLASDLQLKDLRNRIATLTSRERQLIPLIASGLPNKHIAVKLHLSIKTVFKHRASLIKKLNASNSPDLVRLLTTAGDSHLLTSIT